jgi:hypothetical protein
MKHEPRPEWLPAVKKFFEGIRSEWRFDTEESEVLMTTCDRLERFHRCRLQIQEDGQTFKTESGLIKCHPLLAHEKQAFAGFISGCKKLNLEEPEDKKPAHRPVKGPGWNGR